VDKRFFCFLPQEYQGFSNFQVQANKVFNLKKDKKEAVFGDILIFFHGYFL
jgi:hypothetical protein